MSDGEVTIVVRRWLSQALSKKGGRTPRSRLRRLSRQFVPQLLRGSITRAPTGHASELVHAGHLSLRVGQSRPLQNRGPGPTEIRSQQNCSNKRLADPECVAGELIATAPLYRLSAELRQEKK
jgi:hypothetical protein